MSRIRRDYRHPPGFPKSHHVFPQRFAREFRQLGIDVNDPRYGAWWEASSHLRNAAHYNTRWEQFFRGKPTADQAQQFARQLASDYGLILNF